MEFKGKMRENSFSRKISGGRRRLLPIPSRRGIPMDFALKQAPAGFEGPVAEHPFRQNGASVVMPAEAHPRTRKTPDLR